MNIRLYYLIHTEKPYKRYYRQPLNKNYPCRTYPLKRFRETINMWLTAAYLPFNHAYNTQQIDTGGGRENQS